MRTLTKGPRSARVLLVGEAPGENEVKLGVPFIGASGQELGRELAECGFVPPEPSGLQQRDLQTLLARSKVDPIEIRVTNVCHERPPKNKIQEFLGFPKKLASAKAAQFEFGKYYTGEIARGLAALRMEIDSMPNLQLVLGVGNAPLWALTGQWGISKWRGSQLFAKRLTSRPIPFVPTYHPAGVLRMWDWRWQCLMDYRRARLWMEQSFAVPRYNFVVRPSFERVKQYLEYFLSFLDVGRPTRLAADLETRQGHIACLGLAHSARDAICIPFLTTQGSYWKPAEECVIIWLLYRLLTHPLFEGIGQNFLYDQQYLARRWGFKMNHRHDTMIKQHLCLPGVEKGLDFLSSQHCVFHRYWKDEAKEWAPHLGEEQLWIYNCTDAVVTFEANDSLSKMVMDMSNGERLMIQMQMAESCLRMMLRGVNVDLERKRRVAGELEQAMIGLATFVNKCVGFDITLGSIDELKTTRCFNPASSAQVQDLAYKVLQLPVIWKQTDDGRRPTADKDAIAEWLRKVEPLYRPLLQAIADFRSLQVYRSTFALADLDYDGRWRCEINVAGPNTFRFSTKTDAFGFGSNMQNIPKGDEDE
jgi:uracil-DNA glycosylase